MNEDIKNIIKSVIMEVREEEHNKLGIHSSRTGLKTLRVFDFDDTIAKTNSKVGVIEFDRLNHIQIGEKYHISPADYAGMEKDPNKIYQFDYSDFSNVVEPELIEKNFTILKNIVSKMREENGYPAVILTARGHEANPNIRNFLDSVGINIPVQTLNTSDPFAKSEWIKKAMLKNNIPHVEFFDDNKKNVKAVRSLNRDQELIQKFAENLKVRSRLV